MIGHIDLSGIADLDLLGAFLLSERAPPGAMGLPQLDGFLTGIAVGPDLLMPSEWLPAIWGDGNPEFDGIEEARAVSSAILLRYNEILNALATGRNDFVPAPAPGPDGRIAAIDWATGFFDAMRLRPDSWKPLLEDKNGTPAIFPIVLLASPKDMVPPELRDSVDAEALLREAPDHIAESVVAIDAYWKARRGAALPARPPARRSDKIGRNASCPCGSGRKYKKCCGAS